MATQRPSRASTCTPVHTAQSHRSTTLHSQRESPPLGRHGLHASGPAAARLLPPRHRMPELTAALQTVQIGRPRSAAAPQVHCATSRPDGGLARALRGAQFAARCRRLRSASAGGGQRRDEEARARARARLKVPCFHAASIDPRADRPRPRVSRAVARLTLKRHEAAAGGAGTSSARPRSGG